MTSLRTTCLLAILWIVLGLVSVVPAPGRPLATSLRLTLAVACLFGPFLFGWTILRAWQDGYKNGK